MFSKPGRTILTLLLSGLAVLCINASALPLTATEFGATYSGGPAAIADTVGYDANSDIYSAVAVMDQADQSALFRIEDSVLIATDIVGVTMIGAEIDNAGNVISGNFVWVGSSETLNLATGTTLISATLTDVYFDDTVPVIQFRARVDVVSPALRAITGPIRSLLIFEYAGINQAFIDNPWNADFHIAGFTSSPDIQFSPNALPLTPTEALASFFVAPPFAPLSQYDHTTDVYQTNSQVGSSSAPGHILGFPGYATLVSDVVGTVNMVAIIDETGTVDSGLMTWTGQSATLGIPPGSFLLRATPIEALYETLFGQRFEFLFTVDVLHPALEALVGPVETIVMYDFQSPGSAFDANPWSVSFYDDPYTSGPDFFGGPEIMTNSDSDGDGIADRSDNCTAASNGDQRDADSDGIGSRCDADLSQDCVVNAVDLGAMKAVYFSSDANADLNGDGSVNAVDLGIMKSYYFSNYMLDNPSALPDLCDGS